ncbi:MAG: hypothetical protein GX854_11965, partial [Clostridiales bacterium]|nr:hypothetical protein [Clostridiales bacterium]
MLLNGLISAGSALPQGALFILGVIIVIIIVLAIILTFVPLGLWISALAAAVKIGILDLIG